MIVVAQYSLPIYESKLIFLDPRKMETKELLSRLVVDMHLCLPLECLTCKPLSNNHAVKLWQQFKKQKQNCINANVVIKDD